MIQPDMELSDSEDEGEGGRRNRESHKTTGKATSSGKTPEADTTTSTRLSANPRASKSPSVAATSGEAPGGATTGNPTTLAGAEKNDSGAAMDVDTAPNPPN